MNENKKYINVVLSEIVGTGKSVVVRDKISKLRFFDNMGMQMLKDDERHRALTYSSGISKEEDKAGS